MMFVPVVLACTLDYSVCRGYTSSTAFLSMRECQMSVQEGINNLLERNLLVLDFKCVVFNTDKA
jgi:hypothetical protein